MAVLDTTLPPSPALPDLARCAPPAAAPDPAPVPALELTPEPAAEWAPVAVAEPVTEPEAAPPAVAEEGALPKAVSTTAPVDTIQQPAPSEPAPPAARPEPAVAWSPGNATPRRRLMNAAEQALPPWIAQTVEPAPARTGAPELARRRTVTTVAVAAMLLSAITAAALLLLLRSPAAAPTVTGTYNAPMMVVRAARRGQVHNIAVQPGEAVNPDSTLLTLHTGAPPDPAAASVRARLETSRTRLTALDDALAQPTPPTDAGRARVADLRQQRAAAVADATAAQDASDRLTPPLAIDTAVAANVHGVIRSVETQAGADAAPGTPLVRMLDCDHAFLTIGPDTSLRAGQAVQVHLPNLPPAAATVRQSSGLAEPPDSLVVPLPATALGGSCPVGSAATISAAAAG